MKSKALRCRTIVECSQPIIVANEQVAWYLRFSSTRADGRLGRSTFWVLADYLRGVLVTIYMPTYGTKLLQRLFRLHEIGVENAYEFSPTK